MYRLIKIVVVSLSMLSLLFFSLRHLFKEEAEKVDGTVIRAVPHNTPYDLWLVEAKEGIPVFEGLVIQDVRTETLQPWPQMGEDVNGLYLRFADYQMTDGRIVEIPPLGKTKPGRHLFEMGIYFYGGPGHTIIQQEGREPQRIDWGYRSLFSIPLNVRYQHFNDSEKSIRLIAVTSFPFVINWAKNTDFVFDNPFEFTDRYDAQKDYLLKRNWQRRNLTETNFISDALHFELANYAYRGEGNKHMALAMAKNTMLTPHMAEMPSKNYKRAHRHSSDAFILILSGQGYSIAWPASAYYKRRRVNWQEGTLFVPPTYWYHQHFNPSPEPARYLALNIPVLVKNLGLRFMDQMETDLVEIKEEWEKELVLQSVSPRNKH